MQLGMQKFQTDKDDLEKSLQACEDEKADILSKFDQYAAHLNESHSSQLAQISDKNQAIVSSLENKLAVKEAREQELTALVEQ